MSDIRIISASEAYRLTNGKMKLIAASLLGGVLASLLTGLLVWLPVTEERLSHLLSVLLAAFFWLITLLPLFSFLRDRFSREKVYHPGRSFPSFRKSKEKFRTQYRLVMILGIIVTAGSLIGLLGLFSDKGQPSYALSVVLGLFAVRYGYRGQHAIAARQSVDDDVVALLRAAGIAPQEKIYASYTGSPLRKEELKNGHDVFGVLEDRLVFLSGNDQEQTLSYRAFADISALGMSVMDTVIQVVLIRFADGTLYKLHLGPAAHGTTDPLFFIRQFLDALDAFLSAREAKTPTPGSRTQQRSQAAPTRVRTC